MKASEANHYKDSLTINEPVVQIPKPKDAYVRPSSTRSESLSYALPKDDNPVSVSLSKSLSFRHSRSYSTSESDTSHIAEKWGFSLRRCDSVHTKSNSMVYPIKSDLENKPTFTDSLTTKEPRPYRSKSPMQDMIFKGHLLYN